MFIHAESNTIFLSHADIRMGFPNVAFTSTIEESSLAYLGIYPVTQPPMPALADGEIAVQGDAQLVDGLWVRNWVVRPGTPEELAKKAAEMKAKVPERVTMRQARLALMQSGKLGNVAAAIATLPSPQKETAEIEWEFSSEVFRQRALVAMIGAALGLNDAQLDELFILAATL